MLVFELSKADQKTLAQLLQLSKQIPMFFDNLMQDKEKYCKGLSPSVIEVLDSLGVNKQTDESLFESRLNGYTTYFSFDDKEKTESYYCYQVLKSDTKWFDKVLDKYQMGTATKVEQYVLEYIFAIPKEEKKKKEKPKRNYNSSDEMAATIFDIQLGKFARENFEIKSEISKEEKQKILLSYNLYLAEHFEEETKECLEIIFEFKKHLFNHTMEQFEEKWIEPNIINLSIQDAEKVFSKDEDDPPVFKK